VERNLGRQGASKAKPEGDRSLLNKKRRENIDYSSVSSEPFQFSSGKSSSRVSIPVAQPDARSSPVHGTFLSILVGENKPLLRTEEGLPLGEKLDVEIVEDDVLSRRVPVVEIELPAEVHVRAKRSCPLSLPES